MRPVGVIENTARERCTCDTARDVGLGLISCVLARGMVKADRPQVLGERGKEGGSIPFLLVDALETYLVSSKYRVHAV